MKAKSIFFISLVALGFKGIAQDQFFFNTNQSLLFLNPSFAGSNGLIRNQSTCVLEPIFGARQIYANSFDAYFSKIKAGIGLTYLRDDFSKGFIVSNYLGLTYAQHFLLKEKGIKIIPSVRLAYADKEINDSWMGPGYPYHELKTRFLDISSGLLVSYRNFYIGASVFHINMPDEGILRSSRLPKAYSVHASYNATISKNLLLNISARSQSQRAFSVLQSATNVVLYKHFITGIGLTNNMLYVNIGYRNNFISAIVSRGSATGKIFYGYFRLWEFMFSYNLRNKDLRKTLTSFETW